MYSQHLKLELERYDSHLGDWTVDDPKSEEADYDTHRAGFPFRYQTTTKSLKMPDAIVQETGLHRVRVVGSHPGIQFGGTVCVKK
jgi:hypothetical protein